MTPREKAVFLLKIHQGACSVPKGGELEAAFTILQLEEKVTIQPSGTPGFLDIYAKDFQPRFVSPDGHI
jgi:hypothetical protein